MQKEAVHPCYPVCEEAVIRCRGEFSRKSGPVRPFWKCAYVS